MDGMTVGLIWAQGRNREIGRDGALPWRVPEDLARFAARTRGCPVVMGRRTWESLPERNRPLPDRANIVLTRHDGWCAPGAHVAASLREGIELARQLANPHTGKRPAVWVIGGASVYQAALDEGWAAVVEVTEIDAEARGADAFAPTLDAAAWKLTGESPWRTSESGVRYRFLTYEQRG